MPLQNDKPEIATRTFHYILCSMFYGWSWFTTKVAVSVHCFVFLRFTIYVSRTHNIFLFCFELLILNCIGAWKIIEFTRHTIQKTVSVHDHFWYERIVFWILSYGFTVWHPCAYAAQLILVYQTKNYVNTYSFNIDHGGNAYDALCPHGNKFHGIVFEIQNTKYFMCVFVFVCACWYSSIPVPFPTLLLLVCVVELFEINSSLAIDNNLLSQTNIQLTIEYAISLFVALYARELSEWLYIQCHWI